MSDLIEKLHEYARCAETWYEVEMCDAAIKEILRLREANKQLYEKYVDLLFDYLAVKVKLEELQEKPYDGRSTDL
jgi:hypothetical protein